MSLISSQFPQITSPPQSLAEVLVNEALAALPSVVYAYAYQTSSGLTFGYYGGRWGGFSVAAGTLSLTGSATNYIVVDKATGAISFSTVTTNWNDSTNYARVYKVVTGASSITSAEDHRAGPNGVHGGGAGGVGGSGSATGFDFVADSTTTDSDPGTGKLRWNNSTQASATILYIDNADSDSTSLATLWASLLSGAYLKITDAADSNVWQLWKVTSTPTNGTGYYKFAVSLQAQEGGNIANTNAILLEPDASGVSLANDSITYALMQNISVTKRALGRDTAGAGDTEEVTAEQILEWVAGSPARGDILYRDASGWVRLAAGTSGKALRTKGTAGDPTWEFPLQCIAVACSDDNTTALTATTGVAHFINPFDTAINVVAVKASLSTAQTSGSIFTVDINEAGTTILSTKLTIDNTEKNSSTAATAAVISDASIAANAECTVDVDQVGDGTAKGLKVYILFWVALP